MLETLDDDRLKSQQNLELYRQRMCNAFNKRVQLRWIQEINLVLAIWALMNIDKVEKKNSS